MFRKGIFSDVKINDSTNLSRLMSSTPQADSTHIENGTKTSGKLTPKRRAVSPLQNSKGIIKINNSSPVLSRKIDPQVFTDVQSRGLASRIVKYHELNKQNERAAIRSNYSKPGEFPIVNLNSNKELPYIAKRNLSSKNPPIRIAPPDKTNLKYRSSMLRSSGILIKNDHEPLAPTSTTGDVNIRTRSVLDELTEISRKRINNEELKIDSIKKTCIEGNGTIDQSDGAYIGLGGLGHSGNKKRQRDASFSTSPTSISPSKMDNLHLNKKNCIITKKPSIIKNNDILSSLSSSMIFPSSKPNRTIKNIISQPSNSYNTNNVFIQSIERQYHNRLPSFEAQPNHTNKMHLMHVSSSPVVHTYNTSMGSDVTTSNVIATISEPRKAVSQKLLLFNRPEVPQQQTIKINQPFEDSTINFVKPKEGIDNNLIMEPNKINENSLVKRKSNLTGIERSKLAMMLEYLKSDDEDAEDKPEDETDFKTFESAKQSLSTNSLTVAPVTSSLTSLPITSSWITTTQTAASSLPTILSEASDKPTTSIPTVTTASVSPIVASKIETTSTINGMQNTPETSIIKPIVTPNVSTIESKADSNNTETIASPRIGGFSFPINSPVPSSTTSTIKESSVPAVVTSSVTTPTFSFDRKINAIETPVLFSPGPAVSVAESKPQTNPTFSFFNKPTADITKLPTAQLNMPSTINFSPQPPILPTSLINFPLAQTNSTVNSKPVEPISFTSPVQSVASTNLNMKFDGGAAIPVSDVKTNSSIAPATTESSRFLFKNNSNPTTTTATNMFTFNPGSSYTTPDFNKPKVLTSMPSTIQPVSTATSESSFNSFMQNPAPATLPSVSVVKPFSFATPNVPTNNAPPVAEISVFNSGNQPNKNIFGNFPTAPTTTASAFGTFENSPISPPQQNNGFGNIQVASPKQNNVFGNSQAPPANQPMNVFGNSQVLANPGNNSETTLFNFKTATPNNTSHQALTTTETSSNIFKMQDTSSQPTNNVFGGGGMQTKNDIFGGGITNNGAKPGSGVFNFTTPTTTQTNLTSASTFSFAGVNKNQSTSAATNVFGSSNTEQPKPFNFGGSNTLNKIQSPPSFGSTTNDASNNFSFGQTPTVINNNNNSTNKPSTFGSNMFGNSNINSEKIEPSKSAFAFGSPNAAQPQTHGMFSFSNNTNLGISNNNNMNSSAPVPTFGQAPTQNPFSIGPGANAARRPTRAPVRRLNK